MARFSELLDRSAEDIQPPALLPAGTYLVRVKAYPTIEDTTINSNPFERIRFDLVVVAAQDVDEDALNDFGKVADYPLRSEFLFPNAPEEERSREATLNRMKNFLTALGVFPEGASLRDALAAAPGQMLLAEVGHRPDKNDPERFYTEIRRTYAA